MKPDVRDFAIREIGCIVARLRGLGYFPCEKHHLLTTGLHGNGRRRGEKFTIGLNTWSHRGVLVDGWSVGYCMQKLGPSYAISPKLFRELYPDSLLLETQNEWLEKWKKSQIS